MCKVLWPSWPMTPRGAGSWPDGVLGRLDDLHNHAAGCHDDTGQDEPCLCWGYVTKYLKWGIVSTRGYGDTGDSAHARLGVFYCNVEMKALIMASATPAAHVSGRRT
jgi:hypothetical protein